jgi:hypothetical protein
MPNKGKCVSTCKIFEKSECNPPRCKYVNGKNLKYCRLSHKYVMKKPNCNVTRRIKKKDIESNARKTIGRMIKKSGKFLQMICSDSGVCLAFGRKSDEITAFFKGFTDFTYAVSPINKIGMPSANGFIKEIEYLKQGYKSHAILKSSQKPEADNLVYEYLVGYKFINRCMKKVPCFVETYGLYFYDNDSSWKTVKSIRPLEKDILSHLEKQDTINYSKACKESKYSAILIQHIKNAKPLRAYTSVMSYSRFMKDDLLYVLFIIYHALSSFSKQFTHYDLHDENVLIYEPVKGKYIQYMYHNEDGTVTTFNSRYIPKIIDYGRSFFDNGNVNSKTIYDKICNTNDCQPYCGEEYGFRWLDPEPNDYFLYSSKKNESHDLRLLYLLQTDFRELREINDETPSPIETTFIETEKILNKVVYGVGIEDKNDKHYGTEENMNKNNEKKIYNMKGAYLEMKKAIEMDDVILENMINYNDIYADNKLGVLHVYNDGKPMVYEENTTGNAIINSSDTKTKTQM